MNSVEFERVLQKLLMRLVWNLLEYFNIYIHLDVNSDVNSQPFLCNFAGTIGWNYGNCPVNLAEFDWVLQKLLMQSTEPTLWQRRRSLFRWYLSQFSTVFCTHHSQPLRRLPWKFGDVWLSISKVINVMHWNNSVSTSPERWKCGPSLKQHWGSALPPSYMCDWAVRTDKAGRQDWESNYQHYIDIGPISFFFCFFLRYDT